MQISFITFILFQKILLKILVFRQHLNHKEPLVGKDLLDGGRIVRKRFCRSPRSDTVRRFYEFDVDLVGEAASNGDAECYAYAVAAVPGTNAFIGAVNASCPPANIFCPCSVVSGNRQAWLPDGYSRIFRFVCVWPFGLLDFGSATLRCKT